MEYYIIIIREYALSWPNTLLTALCGYNLHYIKNHNNLIIAYLSIEIQSLNLCESFNFRPFIAPARDYTDVIN